MKKPLYNRYERFILKYGYSTILKLDYSINKVKSLLNKKLNSIFNLTSKNKAQCG